MNPNNNMIQSTVQQRIREIINVCYDGNITAMSKDTFISRTTISSIIGEKEVSPGYDVIRKIADISSHKISLEWLITGEGSMLKSEEGMPVAKINNDRDGIPYYADLPVSAGQLDTFMQDAEPTGWVKLPGVTSKALFPVIGCSMKPEINPGDVVGIVQMDSWEIVDPDKTYLIITHDERMIKHLAIDEEDENILWCISPNYPKFKINKSDIKFLYRISFCGKLM